MVEKESQYDVVTSKAVWNGGSYKKGGYFTTYSGVKFNPFDVDAWQNVNIQDIAHASSNICRFNGHVKQFYSLAQHCVLVSYMSNPEDALYGLLHDGSEAYLSDVVRPIKETEAFETYRALEAKLEQDIVLKFNLSGWPMPPNVKAADMEIVVWEAMNLFKPTPGWVTDYIEKHPFVLIQKLEDLANKTGESWAYPFNTWQPFEAKARFMKRFLELSGGVNFTPETP
jgi:hypothetical protein